MKRGFLLACLASLCFGCDSLVDVPLLNTFNPLNPLIGTWEKHDSHWCTTTIMNFSYGGDFYMEVIIDNGGSVASFDGTYKYDATTITLFDLDDVFFSELLYEITDNTLAIRPKDDPTLIQYYSKV